jgi:hypothetical protein
VRAGKLTGRCFVLTLSSTRRWGITLGATAISTYLLDAIATAVGLLFVASHLLHGFDLAFVLLFLALTYVAWGAGLIANLRANWALLEETGISTNALSKAAHDLAKRRTWSLRIRRIAASLGYTGTEIAKETPYYFGAFGAAVLSDSISSNEALIFLGGANLGAAGYEYGLARLVTSVLHRKSASGYASFTTDWIPKDYLSNYYSVVQADEQRTISFFVEATKKLQAGESVLFFGVGPTLHHVFLVADKASEIHLGDLLRANLQEIERWIERKADAHDWRPFVDYTLACEARTPPTAKEISQREDLTRAKITKLLELDVRSPAPLGQAEVRLYDTVISAYCADSATDDRETWATYMERILGLVRPGGTFITAALRRSSGYLVGTRTFPSANVDVDDVRAVLEVHFAPEDITIEVCELGGPGSKGYSSIVLARAYRKAGSGGLRRHRMSDGLIDRRDRA